VEAERDCYSNETPSGKFRWTRIRYVEREVVEWRGKWWVLFHRADGEPHRLGTFRIRIKVIQRFMDGTRRIAKSPGAEATDTYGIVDAVHRVTIRRDDTFLGWSTAFFNLPYIWGSAGPPALFKPPAEEPIADAYRPPFDVLRWPPLQNPHPHPGFQSKYSGA
jgi:hypothetical protein